jgi:hypothetical protein
MVQPIDLRVNELDTWLADERQALLAPLEQYLAAQDASVGAKLKPSAAGRHLDLDQLQRQEIAPGLTPRRLKELAARRDAGEELSRADQELLTSGEAATTATMKEARTRLRGLAVGYEPEDRSPEGYRAEVDAYLTAAQRQALNQRMLAAVQNGVGRLQPVLANPTERNFTKIQVEALINEPTFAADPEDLPSEPVLPSRPRRWGQLRPRSWLGGGFALPSPRIPPVRSTVRLPPEVVIDQGPQPDPVEHRAPAPPGSRTNGSGMRACRIRARWPDIRCRVDRHRA